MATPKTKQQTLDGTAKSFWSDNSQYMRGGLNFVSRDHREYLVESGAPLRIGRVRFDADNVYNGQSQPRWELTVSYEIEGQTQTGIIGLGDNAQRRDLFGAMSEWLQENDTEVVAILSQVFSKTGQPFYVLDPVTDEVPF